MQAMLKNWRTTAAGVATLLAALSHLVAMAATGHADAGVIGTDVAAVLAALGLVAAKDADTK